MDAAQVGGELRDREVELRADGVEDQTLVIRPALRTDSSRGFMPICEAISVEL